VSFFYHAWYINKQGTKKERTEIKIDLVRFVVSSTMINQREGKQKNKKTIERFST